MIIEENDKLYVFNDVEDIYEYKLYSFSYFHKKEHTEVSPGIWHYQGYYSICNKINYYYSNNKETLMKFRKKLKIEEL